MATKYRKYKYSMTVELGPTAVGGQQDERGAAETQNNPFLSQNILYSQ